ncbi:unnamed protein product [Rotaria sp. Silwood1]|nr:unnamed protein product [Rotaria sp. Silwood1]CAF1564824.1 unnamed protein product [Rotaria sp. Silwood1]CAF3805603.1 unnamed protein product [Rotaria sp. Silwood1]CAF4709258.1 unnamed protein product [Rotaria sp. Silwood1]
MSRTESSNINHCVAPLITSPVNCFTKDSIQRSDEIKTEFTSREGTYKISSLIDNLGKIGTSTCLNEPVKITLLSRVQNICDTNSQTSSRRSSSINNNDNSNEEKQLSLINGNELNQPNGSIFLTDILAFNVGRELIIYEFAEAIQPNFGEPIDHRVYKQNHQPTCHDITQDPNTNILHVLVGFSKGQIQYINMQTKEQKVFNEGSYLDKTKVTCIKWLPSPRTYFLASYSSGYLYVYDEQLNYQRDTNIQPTYSTIKDDEKNFSISNTKNKSKQARNPISRWSIGNGSINEFAFSPDNVLLAVVSQDGFLRIFNYEKMELIAYMKSYFGGLLCVCWSPDGKYIATGGEDDFITLFSLDPNEHTSRVICRGHGHTSWINAISFDTYMNAKTYYSSFIQPSSSFNNDNENNHGIKKFISYTNGDASYCDTNIPSLFYRIGSVGQDNRLCLWDITEDILKININSKQNSITYPLISTTSSSIITSNGYLSSSSDIIINNQISTTTKSSFSSLTSRLSFVRHSNKINKSIDDTSDITLLTQTNGSLKKSRKLPLFSNTSSGNKSISSKTTTTTITSDDTNQNLLLNNNNNNLSSRQTSVDLTKSTFGTNLCPKLDDIQVIEPIITEFIAHERLNGIYFGENYLITSSQDGLITIWEKPQKLLNINTTDDRTMSSTTLINSNSHHSTVSQRL